MNCGRLFPCAESPLTVFEDSTILSILSAGASPSWTSIDDEANYTGYPAAADAGVYLNGALKTLVAVDMREAVHRRTARVTIPTYDGAADYTVTINATAITVAAAAHATLNELIDALATAINASGAINALVTASDEDNAGTTLLIVGDVDADFTIDATATGTGTVAIVADPDTASVRIWGSLKAASGETAPSGWRLVNDATFAIDERGFLERFDTAGFDRLYVELASVDGTGDGDSDATLTITYVPTVRVGPTTAS